jgi:hypothetical protein
MITFPSTARVGRIMPKEAFYKQLALSPELKNKFVSDVRRITVEYTLTADSIHVDQSNEIHEILILSIQLKKEEFDYRIVEAIARQNAHKIVFILIYGDRSQLVLYYSKLYKTEWQPTEMILLDAKGRDLEAIWQGFIEQIVLVPGHREIEGLSVDERIQRQEQIAKLQRNIEKLDRMTHREMQPKKKFEMYRQLQNLRKQLEKMNGK